MRLDPFADPLQTEESQRVDGGGRGGSRFAAKSRPPVKAAPGSSPDAASMPATSESRLRSPNGVTSVSETVSAAPADSRDRGVDILDTVAEVEGVVRPIPLSEDPSHGWAGVTVATVNSVLVKPNRLSHILIAGDVSDLGGARSGAVVDVEVLWRERPHVMPPMLGRAAADIQQRRNTDNLVGRLEALDPRPSVVGSKVVSPMVKASAPMVLSPASRPVKASPGCIGAAASKLPNSESRLMLPNGVTRVSVTVSLPAGARDGGVDVLVAVT